MYVIFSSPLILDSFGKYVVVKKVITKISKFYGNSCQGLIVPSNKTKDALIHYGLKQKNIYTIPTGLELERF